jgi:hypothetical protein
MLRCLNGSSNVQITKHAGSVSCSECFMLVTATTFSNIMVFGLGRDHHLNLSTNVSLFP